MFKYIAFFLVCGCQATFKSPVTQIEYTGQISRGGITISALPPLWEYVCDLYDYIMDLGDNQTQSQEEISQ
jgi:hypothetical protein